MRRHGAGMQEPLRAPFASFRGTVTPIRARLRPTRAMSGTYDLRAIALWGQCFTTTDGARESVDDKPRFRHPETDAAQRGTRTSDAHAFVARTDRYRVLSKYPAIDSSHDGRLLHRMYDSCFQLIDTIDR